MPVRWPTLTVLKLKHQDVASIPFVVKTMVDSVIQEMMVTTVETTSLLITQKTKTATTIVTETTMMMIEIIMDTVAADGEITTVIAIPIVVKQV